MMHGALVATGHGYEKGEAGPCQAFAPYEILANPLGGFSAEDRERRVFNREGQNAVTYGSHALYLMRKRDGDAIDRRRLFVAVHNGSGRTVWAIPTCSGFSVDTAEALCAMPERALYSLLWGITELADAARREALEGERTAWKRAAIDKRIRISRQPSKGRAFAWIEPAREEGESEERHAIRKIFAKPAGVK